VKLMVVVYVVVGVFIIKKRYLDNEKASGWIICRILRQQTSDSGFSWDVSDRTTNPGEIGAVFVPTRILITRGQTQQEGQYCPSPQHPCTKPSDCDIGNVALQKQECIDGFCTRRQWCPAENALLPTTETHYLDTDDVELWFSSYVHYHKFMLDVSTTDEVKQVHYPHARANTYKLRDLLRMANLDKEDFVENGAVLIVNALYDCNLDDKKCQVQVETMQVDTATGFNHVHNHVYFENGIRKRDSYRMYGIRIAAFATGFGRRTSMAQIILQLSSAIAMLSVAEMITDFWLMSVVPERRHYTEQKIQMSEDFNED